MAPVATMLPTVLLLIALSTASARFLSPEMLGDPYGLAEEQELDVPGAGVLQGRISGEMQEYEEPLMSEIQARCHNYHGYLAGNIRIAGTVCRSSSSSGCARVMAGRRGLIGTMQLCHPNGKHAKW